MLTFWLLSGAGIQFCNDPFLHSQITRSKNANHVRVTINTTWRINQRSWEYNLEVCIHSELRSNLIGPSIDNNLDIITVLKWYLNIVSVQVVFNLIKRYAHTEMSTYSVFHICNTSRDIMPRLITDLFILFILNNIVVLYEHFISTTILIA